ncbi:hypothetical protein ABZ942_38305 [Nocardia sp. NPDC046473]|uniref:hypothetical protein n=1 Tax=Nocardia sp. NPDC046473 TaxID=3155733 RepID=UPI0033E4A8B8
MEQVTLVAHSWGGYVVTGAYFLEALDVPAVTTVGIPAAYILSEEDRVLARPGLSSLPEGG